MLHLPISFDFALQSDEFFGALVDSPENLKSHGAHHNEQHRDCEKCRKQFDLYASWCPRNEAYQPPHHLHHGSCSRLKRSWRNSFGSKRTPRYWTRRIPRRSIIDVRNVWSTSPFADFNANTP